MSFIWALWDGSNLNEVCQLPTFFLQLHVWWRRKIKAVFTVILQTLWENNKRLHTNTGIFTYRKRRHIWQLGICPFYTYLWHSLTPTHTYTHAHKLITIKFISYIITYWKKPSTLIASINQWAWVNSVLNSWHSADIIIFSSWLNAIWYLAAESTTVNTKIEVENLALNEGWSAILCKDQSTPIVTQWKNVRNPPFPISQNVSWHSWYW